MSDSADAALRRALDADEAHERTHERDSLDRSVTCWEVVLAHPDFDSLPRSTRALVVGATATARFIRYRVGGAADDLDRAIALYQRLASSGHQDAGDLSNLANSLMARYEARGVRADADASLAFYEHAVSLTPEDDPLTAGLLSNLGNALMTAYEVDDRSEDMGRAIGAYEKALEKATTSEQKAGCAANLAAALRARHERSGELADLETAITLGRRAVDTTRDPIELPLRQNTLGAALLGRYAALGKSVDLDLALELLEQATAATPLSSPSRPGVANNLGNAKRARYDDTGEIAELDEAIALLEEAVARATKGTPNLAPWLANLGVALNARYDATGDLEDLELAIAACEAALDAPAGRATDRTGHLSNLANGLVALFERSGDAAQLDRAVDCYREAARITSAPRERSISLSNLGYALQVRYQHVAREVDLCDAVAAYEQAYAASPDTEPLHWRVLGNLSGALHLRNQLTGDREYLARAIAGYQATAEHIGEGSPDAPVAWSNLALGLQSRYDSDRKPADLLRAVELYRRSCEEGVRVRPGMFLEVAKRWGDWAVTRQEWHEAADAFDAALDGLNEVVRSQAAREHKENWLRDAVGVSGDAAVAAVRACQLERAATALERGRAVLLSDALSREPTDLDELADRGLGALADRFRAAAARLTVLERRSEGPRRARIHAGHPAVM